MKLKLQQFKIVLLAPKVKKNLCFLLLFTNNSQLNELNVLLHSLEYHPQWVPSNSFRSTRTELAAKRLFHLQFCIATCAEVYEATNFVQVNSGGRRHSLNSTIQISSPSSRTRLLRRSVRLSVPCASPYPDWSHRSCKCIFPSVGTWL